MKLPIRTLSFVVISGISLSLTAAAFAATPQTASLYAQHQTSSTLFNAMPETNTFSAEFRSEKTPQKVSIDLELFDESGKQLLQKSWSNVTLSPTTSTLVSLTSPKNLSTGVYTWKAGIFSADWKQKIEWYDSAATFAVLGTTTSSTPHRAMLSGIVQLKKMLKPGDQQFMMAYFNTPETSLGTYIDMYLLDDNNAIVGEQTSDKNYLGYGYDITKSTTTPALSAGSYHWGIALFSIGRQKLYAWIDNLAPFTVATSTENQ